MRQVMYIIPVSPGENIFMLVTSQQIKHKKLGIPVVDPNVTKLLAVANVYVSNFCVL